MDWIFSHRQQAPHPDSTMKPDKGELFMWLIKISFLVALSYAASDIREQADTEAANSGQSAVIPHPGS